MGETITWCTSPSTSAPWTGAWCWCAVSGAGGRSRVVGASGLKQRIAAAEADRSCLFSCLSACLPALARWQCTLHSTAAGIVANMLVCLAIWLATASRDAAGKILGIYL